MSVKVELGFTEAGAGGPFFRLDNTVSGVLDNTEFFIGGEQILVDVSQHVRRVTTDRGKSRDLDRYQAGRVSVEFNNSERLFDPTFETGPFFGQIEPRRQIRVSFDDVVTFAGIVDDWNLSYDPSGFSVAVCNAFDAFSSLANIIITEPDEDFDDFPEETTGSRIQRVLDFIGWDLPTDIQPGKAVLYDSLVPFNTNVLAYIQLVADSEPGDLFVDKLGRVAFRQRNDIGTGALTVADDSSGIKFGGVEIVFGSEQLYNNITASNEDTTLTVQDDLSVSLYGERDLTVTSLIASEEDLARYAQSLLVQYRNPEYRFETVSFNLLTKSPTELANLLALEIGDPVIMKFTPSGIGDQILRISKCIGITHQRVPGNEVMTLKLQTYATRPWILSDPLFGRLSAGNSLSF